MKRSWVVFLLWAVVLLAALNTGQDLYYHLVYVLSVTIVLSFLLPLVTINDQHFPMPKLQLHPLATN